LQMTNTWSQNAIISTMEYFCCH